jgi:hypothetical protein
MMDLFGNKILDLIQSLRPCLAPKREQEFLEEALQRFVSFAVETGVMPQTSKSGTSALKMVECYGARWFLYAGPFYCPYCNEDLRDHQSGPPFKHEILQTSINNDGRQVHKLICPKCNNNVFSGK